MKTFLLVLVAVRSQAALSAGHRLLSIVVRLTPFSVATGDWLGPSGPCWIPFLWDNSGETGALIVDCNTLATQRHGGKKRVEGPRDSSPDLSPLQLPESWEKIHRTPDGAFWFSGDNEEKLCFQRDGEDSLQSSAQSPAVMPTNLPDASVRRRHIWVKPGSLLITTSSYTAWHNVRLLGRVVCVFLRPSFISCLNWLYRLQWCQ